MSPRYKPGTVATILIDGNETTGLAATDGWIYADSAGSGHVTFQQVQVVRPLVVLEFRRHTPSEFAAWLRKNSTADSTARYAAHQIESQIGPPKPDEPGRYGVVVAGDGREWFRYTDRELTGHDWVRVTDSGTFARYARWEDLDVVRVVREGWSP